VNDKLRLLTGLTLVLTLGVVPACPGDDGTAEGTAGSSSSADSGSSGPGMTSTPMTMTATMTTAMTMDGDSSTSSSGPSTITEPTTEDTGPVCAEAELGASCLLAECDCESDNCFLVGPLGGVCSECDSSEDCEATTGFGCNFGNPLTMTPAVCSTTGDVGESCESVDDCAAGLFCPTLIEVAGILTVATCSECEEDMGCMGGDICTPTYDIVNIAGNYYCAAPGSVPDDEGCNLTGDGSECASGNCAPASLMMIPVVAVCSPCNEDMDCAAGETCMFPEVALAGNALELIPGGCV
jgi:hypothetical protein